MIGFLPLILLAIALSFSASAANIPNLANDLINLSSHSSEFLKELLGGRVWIYKRNGAPAAMYFRSDGHFRNCSMRTDDRSYRTSHPDWEWGIGTRNNRTSLQITLHPTTRTVAMIVIYTPRSGRFHAEQYFKRTRDWRIVHDGWIQNTVPAVIHENCPNLRDLPDLPIDGSQTHTAWDKLLRSATPVLNHPGHEYGYIGATGLGTTASRPTLTPEQAFQIDQRLHGVIGMTPRGRRLVNVNTPQGKEIWLIDRHDDVVDIGSVSALPHRDVNVIRWHGSTPDYAVRTRYPIPVRPTPRLHPAFQIVADLAVSSQPVTLHHPAASAGTFVFAADGHASSPGGKGTWWISEGEIKLLIDGKLAGYPWREFAAAAGWKPPHSPAPPLPEFEIGGD